MCHGSIWSTDFKSINWSSISYNIFELRKNNFEKSTFESHFTNSCDDGTASFILEFHSLALEPSVTVVEFTVLDSHCMNHCITIKPMMTFVFWHVLYIWSISQVNTCDVSRYFSLDNLCNLVWLLSVDRTKITEHNWIWFFVHSFFLSSLDNHVFPKHVERTEEHEETNLINWVH